MNNSFENENTEIDNNLFLEIFKSVKDVNKELIGATPAYITLYISSINTAKLLFTNKLGQKFYPSFTGVYWASFIHQMQDQETASFVRYDDPLNSGYFSLKPFQYSFQAKSRRAKDIWSLSLSFLLPDRFLNCLNSIEFEEVVRINTNNYGEQKTPLIRLQEYRSENNQIKVETLINENLPTTNTTYKIFSF